MGARLLWETEPEGLDTEDFIEPLSALLDDAGWPGKIEVTCEENDVVLSHLLVVHSSNPNHGVRPRVMAQPEARSGAPCFQHPARAPITSPSPDHQR